MRRAGRGRWRASLGGDWSKAAALGIAFVLVVGLVAAACGKEIAVRILPAVAATNPVPLTLGLRVGFLEGTEHPLRAERLLASSLNADNGVSLTRTSGTGQERECFLIKNTAAVPRGVSLLTRGLRQGVSCTVRVRCRQLAGRTSLCLVFAPVTGGVEVETSKSVSLKREGVTDATFVVVPPKEAAYRCSFQIKPGSEVAFDALSMVPDDAESGWDHEALEALRAIRPGTLCWPIANGLERYNWYDGVGPLATRPNVSPTGRAEDGHTFGTAEFVDFCRLVGAEPVLRVWIDQPVTLGDQDSGLAAGLRLAADWVAYCNATGSHPLAQLRLRQGRVAPLGVKNWELALSGGGVLDGAICTAYATAMQAEDPSVSVVSSESRCLPAVRDRYVTDLFGRLEAGPAEDLRYYSDWYDTLGMGYAAIKRLSRGQTGAVTTGYSPEQVLFRVTQARNMLTEAGALMELINRYPASLPLIVEKEPDLSDGSLRVQAAWAQDAAGLVIFVYNSGPNAATVHLDLTSFQRRFVFWVADQLAADITVRRAARTLPVNRVQKAGAAITQSVLCEAAPSSFTRIFVKE